MLFGTFPYICVQNCLLHELLGQLKIEKKTISRELLLIASIARSLMWLRTQIYRQVVSKCGARTRKIIVMSGMRSGSTPGQKSDSEDLNLLGTAYITIMRNSSKKSNSSD